MRSPSVSELAAIGIGRPRRLGPGLVAPTGPEGPAPAVGLEPDDAPACNAWANCSIDSNRSAATAASARRIASSSAEGKLGLTVRTLGAGSLNRLATIAWAVAPLQGGSPVSIS